MTKSDFIFGFAVVLALIAGAGYFQNEGLQMPVLADQSTPVTRLPAFELPVLKTAGLEYLKDNGANKIQVKAIDFIGKTLLINFWASWCKVCKKEKPFLRSLQNAYLHKGFVVVGIATSDEKKAILDSGILEASNYPVLFDQSGFLLEKMNVQALPNSYLIAPDGKVLKRIVGPIDDARTLEIRKILESNN